MYSKVRLVLLSGDWIPLSLIDATRKNFPGADIVSLGGATEASIWSINYNVNKVKEKWTSIPYGSPLKNQKMYVLNYNLQLCPFDVIGEIYIGGSGLANEYRNNSENTKEAFIDHPEFKRLYRTGDYGRMVKDGDEIYIEFSGRIDNPVKIRGYRIEPEVEQKKLLKPEFVQNRKMYVPARNDLEKKLVHIFEKETGLSHIGVTDDFFTLGANSILLVSIINRIRKEGHINLSFKDIVEKKSISRLADFISEHLMENRDSAYYFDAVMDEANQYEKFPLTEIQNSYLIGRQGIYELGNTSTHGYMEFTTSMNIERMSQAFNKVIERHAMLRCVFDKEGNQQVLNKGIEYVIDLEDVSDLSVQDQNRKVEEIRNQMSHYIFNPEKWPLFEIRALKLDSKTNYVFAGYDLLIVDGSSMQIINKELLLYYRNLELELPELEFTFRDYIIAYEKFKKESEIYKRDKQYWMNQISDFPLAPELPLMKKILSVQDVITKRKQKVFSKNQWEQIKDKAKEFGVTTTVLICLAFCDVLGFWSNQSEFALNMTIFNRYPFHKQMDQIVGEFTSNILLRVNLENEGDEQERALALQKQLFEALEHKHFEGVEFMREISKYYGMNRKAVMPIVFSSMIFDGAYDVELSEDEVKNHAMGISQTSQVYLDCQVSDSGGELTIVIDYVEELFKKSVIDTLFQQFTKNILKLIEPERDYLPEINGEDRMLVEKYNSVNKELKINTLHSMFRAQADRVPNNIAVVLGNDKIDYVTLDMMSNQVARYLKGQRIQRNDYIAIEASREINTIVNILGVLKACAAYVPVDPSYPVERRNYIIENSKAKIYLESNLYQEKGLEKYDSSVIENNFYPGDIAYTIYTSGSTGTPKGVAVTHKAVCNTIQDVNDKFGVTDNDKLIGISSMCFDLSVYDIFGTFEAGATLVMIPDPRDVVHIIREVEDQGVTIWNSVPSTMELALETVEEFTKINRMHGTSGKEIMMEKSKIRLVLLSGDWIPLGLPQKIKDTYKGSDVISLGGATEASIWSIYYPVENVKNTWSSIPYGMPLSNQTMHVLNYKKQLCPIDVAGEIYIGGVGLANEYRCDKEKTENAFIEHEVLGRLYRTGDFGVMRNEDGQVYIEFLGRKDSQVKIRGYRVELGEIEKCILKNEDIKSAIVTSVKSNKDNSQILCAYIILKEDCIFDEKKIVEQLGKDLPEYMIPSHFVKIDSVPLSQNGKINYKALPKIEFKSVKEYVEPRNDAEKYIVSIYQSVLEKEKVGIDDNFFDLGGDSIQLIRAHTRLSERVDIKISLLFELGTPRKIADYIEKNNLLLDAGIYTKFEDIKVGYQEALSNPVTLSESDEEYIQKYRNEYQAMGEVEVLKNEENILLTGASGYLGIYLLKEFMENTKAKVYVVVRKREDKSTQDIIRELWNHYHVNTDFEQYVDRIVFLEGDLSKENLEMSETDYQLLSDSVDCVVNSAANVNHYLKYEESYAVNVQGIINLIELAKTGKKKVVHHFSTTRVAEGKVEGKRLVIYTEECGNVNQKSNNVYNITKLESEEIVKAARKEGVVTNIYRIGNLQCSSETGITQISSEKNAFMSTIRSFLKIGRTVVTPWDKLNFSFVNEVAKALNILIHCSYAQNATFHVQSSNDISLSSMVKEFNKLGYPIQELQLPEFIDYLVSIKDKSDLQDYVDLILLHSGIAGIAEKDKTDYIFFSEKTNYILEKLGFSWGEMSEGLFIKMVEDYQKNGFLERRKV